MLRDVWNRLGRRNREVAVEHEAERERMTPAERRLSEESIDDIQPDWSATEHLGGIRPERLLEDDEPPRR
jgi:hypothetical protein